ncbi:response regulator [Paenibacillus sp. OAS669]|uniref:response regulator n=1 Tax=Paenibacillus sp. OAS669 TaxID=2663821 RepID=UPI001789B769|nr:response regulator [Paenibacillus sp. OAS669]MBE1440586.1 two-component system response regulator YesN [Paenibacillus sp. OAS669]
MITVVLADDEPMIIKGLKKLLPWEELGIRIAGEAWTGQGLMELIEKVRPSLVITDISMPGGSGIDVIKEINQAGLRTKVIFISAYQEFSYAKDALALGAVDYLVKPVEKGTLLKSVQRAMAEVREESEEQQFKSKLAHYEHKDKKTQLEEVFDRLLDGDIRQEEAEEKLRILDAGYVYDHYTVMLLETVQPVGVSRWGEHEKRLLLFAIGNMAEELVRRNSMGILLRKGDLLCAVVNHKEDASMEALAEEIISNAVAYLKMNLSIGIGWRVSKLQEIKISYRAAAEALEQAYFAESVCAISRKAEEQESKVSERELGEARHDLLQALLAKDSERLSGKLENLLELVVQYSGGSREKAVMACYTTIIECGEGLEDVGITLEATGAELQGHLAVMQGFNRFGELAEYIREIVLGLLERLTRGGLGKEAQQLLIAKEFIESHYMENLTLEGVASKVYMNPYYFSSFFKKHTQMNFKQYVTEVRMMQAVKLLLNTDLMIYEIADKVGYNNARQFSDMFKKHYGKLPQEYKSRLEPKT